MRTKSFKYASRLIWSQLGRDDFFFITISCWIQDTGVGRFCFECLSHLEWLAETGESHGVRVGI